mgnify:CR=1 FL=1
MGLDGSVGLTNVLIGQANLSDALQQFADAGLVVLGAGPVPPNPSELLGSAAMEKTLRELESRFDVVILAAPPRLPAPHPAAPTTPPPPPAARVAARPSTPNAARHSVVGVVLPTPPPHWARIPGNRAQ